jgi:hypothetical protein
MVGTLVVTLPFFFRGGVVIEHREITMAMAPPDNPLSSRSTPTAATKSGRSGPASGSS